MQVVPPKAVNVHIGQACTLVRPHSYRRVRCDAQSWINLSGHCVLGSRRGFLRLRERRCTADQVFARKFQPGGSDEFIDELNRVRGKESLPVPPDDEPPAERGAPVDQRHSADAIPGKNAFAEKYKNPHWRPITAIRGAAGLGLPALKADAQWEPLLGTPPHPEYPSAHAVFSGAAEAVLTNFFGADSVNVSVTFPPLFGITRSYTRFSQITEEVDNARVWGGIHFRSADKDGSAAGRRIGAMAIRDFPRPAQSVAEVQ